MGISNLDFYKTFISSAKAFVPEDLQEKLRTTRFLIAGNGSIGNPTAMLLARSGAEYITNADPELIEVSNLSRQEFFNDQVGKNKAVITSQNIMRINSRMAQTIQTISEGITNENVERLVKGSEIIIDGIDIRAADMMWELHKHAAQLKKPVIVGYDLAGLAMLIVFRYDKKKMDPLDGTISQNEIEQFIRIKTKYLQDHITESQFLSYVYEFLSGPVNPLLVPIEQLEEIINRRAEDTSTYQLGTTARLISVLCVETIKQILLNKPVKKVIYCDAPSLVRCKNPNVLFRLRMMFATLAVIQKRGSAVRSMLVNLGE